MGLKVAILTSGIPADVEAAARAGEALSEEAACALAPAQWLHDALVEAGHDVAPLHLSRANNCEALSTLRGFHADVVWPLSCAPRRSSGVADTSVPDMLALLGLPFVGSTSSVRRALAGRTYIGDALERAVAQGETPAAMAPHTVALSEQAATMLGDAGLLDLVAQAIPEGYPLCVTPARIDAEVRPQRVATPEALARALDELFARAEGGETQPALVQPWVEGVELYVPVLGDADDVLALPPVEVARATGARPADAAGTTVSGAPTSSADPQASAVTTRLVAPVRPASLSHDDADAQAIRSEIERAAVDAYLACGCRDLGCVHLVWDGGRAVVLGIDAAPSLADDAPLALAARAADIPLATIADQLVAIAAERGR